MFTQQRHISRIFLIFGLLFLASCSNEVKPQDYQQQRTFFLTAIEKAQQAGALLQQKKLSPPEISQAMDVLDSSMMNANSVEDEFLKWLDSGLYQAFSAYLVKGIENYRLGVEADDREQQVKGLEKLQRWWQFWQLKRPAVLEKLEAS